LPLAESDKVKPPAIPPLLPAAPPGIPPFPPAPVVRDTALPVPPAPVVLLAPPPPVTVRTLDAEAPTVPAALAATRFSRADGVLVPMPNLLFTLSQNRFALF